MGSKVRARAGAVVGALAALGGLALAEACRSPTQVTLDIAFRGESCTVLRSVAIVVADDANIAESRVTSGDYSTTTTGCVRPDGHIGTLVLTPGDRDRGAVIVVAGLDRAPEECKPSNGYFGCIVARRTFTFIDHTPLRLPVVLDFSCKNVPCDAVSTCKTGGCVSSEVVASGDEFVEPGTPLADGAVPYVDAPTSTDGSDPRDGAPPPPPPPTDSGSDADAADAADARDGGTCSQHDIGAVQCPGVGLCPRPSICGYGPAPDGGATYTCGGGAYMNYLCTGAENCPVASVCCSGTYLQDAGGPYPGPYGGGSCQTSCGGNAQLCHSDCECTPPKTCMPGGAGTGLSTCQ